MSKLLNHFKAMQGMASRWLEPGPYTDREGTTSTDADTDVGGDFEKKFAAHLFISDMLYMLDGPEQREAELDAARMNTEAAEAAEWRMDIRRQVEQADAIAKGAVEHAKGMEKRNAELQTQNNELRTLLFQRELDYAKLRGYLDAQRDAEPPRMVPEQREPAHARYRDGTEGSAGWGKTPWYYR